jgi:hypothetical protein
MNVNAQFPGSARVSRAGERVLAIADFPWTFATTLRILVTKQSSFRRDAEPNTRDACSTQTS